MRIGIATGAAYGANLKGKLIRYKNFFHKENHMIFDTTRLTDSVSLLTKEGFELRHECFEHAPIAPEEVTEE